MTYIPIIGEHNYVADESADGTSSTMTVSLSKLVGPGDLIISVKGRLTQSAVQSITYLRLGTADVIDTGTNYFSSWNGHNGSATPLTTGGDGLQSAMAFVFLPAANATANRFGSGRATLFDYDATDTRKYISAASSTDSDDTDVNSYLQTVQGLYRPTSAAISDVQIQNFVSNFVAGSHLRVSLRKAA